MRLAKLTNRVIFCVFTVIFQLDALDTEALEVVSLIRSAKNRRAPINRLPRDVLALIPDFWSGLEREKIAIILTHVCRAWRELFISLASLWTDFRCVDADKTRSYLERSKSAPISLRLERPAGLFWNDPFLEVAPHIVSRLKNLIVQTAPHHLQGITQHLVHPAPLLEAILINGRHRGARFTPTLTAELFDRDLSSLRQLYLLSVNTPLPWRNMSNLTSFSLGYTSDVSIGQIIDFLESAPRLIKVELHFAAPTPGAHAQSRRSVTLAHLRRLTISGSQRPSSLLDHFVIPVGANVSTVFSSPGPNIDDHLPTSFENLRNFSHFTKILLLYKPNHPYAPLASIRFIGPSGQVSIASSCPAPDAMFVVPRSLARFDTSKTQCLEIIGSDFTTELHLALLPLKDLRTLIISRSCDTGTFLLAIHPPFSPDGSIVCPKLEELIFSNYDRFDIDGMVEVAEARASEGAPLKLVEIVSCGEPVSAEGVAELLKYVSRVETRTVTIDEGDDDSFDEDSDEER